MGRYNDLVAAGVSPYKALRMIARGGKRDRDWKRRSWYETRPEELTRSLRAPVDNSPDGDA